MLLWMLWGLLALGRQHFGIFRGKINLDPRDSGFRARNFALGIFSGFFRGFQIPIPIPRIFGISVSGFSRDFQIPIPISGILGFSGFFDLAQDKKSHPEANSDLIRW